MTQRDVWVRWEGEHIAECAIRPSDDGAWSKYVPASDVLPLQAHIATLTAQLEEARAALEWYADVERYSPPCDCCDQDPSVNLDGGQIACAALAKLTKGET